MSTTSVSELGYLFLTCPVCIRIASDLDVKDYTAMDEFLDDVKSYNTKQEFVTIQEYYGSTLNIQANKLGKSQEQTEVYFCTQL